MESGRSLLEQLKLPRLMPPQLMPHLRVMMLKLLQLLLLLLLLYTWQEVTLWGCGQPNGDEDLCLCLV